MHSFLSSCENGMQLGLQAYSLLLLRNIDVPFDYFGNRLVIDFRVD